MGAGWTRIFLTAKYANHAKGRWEGRKEENLTTDFTDFHGWESIRSRRAESWPGRIIRRRGKEGGIPPDLAVPPSQAAFYWAFLNFDPSQRRPRAVPWPSQMQPCSLRVGPRILNHGWGRMNTDR